MGANGPRCVANLDPNPLSMANLDPRGMVVRITKHCYTQNIKALGFVVSEKKIFFMFSYCKSMGANDPRGVANLDPMDMIGRCM